MLVFPTPTPATRGQSRSGAAGNRVCTLSPERGTRLDPFRAGRPSRRLWPDGPAVPDLRADPDRSSRDPDPEPGRLRPDRLSRLGRRPVRPGEGAGSDPRRVPRQPQADRGEGRLDRRLRALPAGCRVPGQDRGARLRDQRHGLAAIAHRDDRERGAGDRQRGERHRSRTGSRTGSVARRSASRGTTPTGEPTPRTSGSSCAGAPTRRRG